MSNEPQTPLSSAPAASQRPVSLVASVRRFSITAPGDWARAVLFLILLALLAALTYRYASYTAALLRYPYEWDDDEAFAVHFAQRLLDHQPIYVDFDKLPMVSLHYPPLFPAAIALLVPKYGATLLAGRLVSLASVVGIGLLVILIVRQETRRWSLGLLAALLVVAGPYVTIFAPLSRHDAMAMFLALAGVLFVRQYPRSCLALLLGLVVLVLACFTKVQAVILVPAAFWHLARRGWKTSLVAAHLFAIAGVACLIYLQVRSGGQFWRSAVTAQASDYLRSFLASRTREFLQEHAILVAIAVGAVIHQIARRDLDAWGALTICSVVIVLLTGKRGAAINYYIPFIVAASICTAIAVDRLTRLAPIHWLPGTSAGVMAVLSLQCLVWWLYPVPRPTEADRNANDRIVRLLRESPGDVLTERRAMLAMRAGKAPQVEICTLYMAYQIGREFVPAADGKGLPAWRPKPGGRIVWDPAELVRALNERRFSMLVFAGEFFPPEVLAAVMANYRELRGERFSLGSWHGTGRYFLLVPRTPPATQPAPRL